MKCYLGEGKEAQEFAKQFLDRRSRWVSSQKSSGDNDRNAKYQGINAGSQYQVNVAQEFQEVKGKGSYRNRVVKSTRKNLKKKIKNKIILQERKVKKGKC